MKKAIKRDQKDFVTEEQVRVINEKQYVTLKEAALLLNISALHFKELDFRWKDVL